MHDCVSVFLFLGKKNMKINSKLFFCISFLFIFSCQSPDSQPPNALDLKIPKQKKPDKTILLRIKNGNFYWNHKKIERKKLDQYLWKLKRENPKKELAVTLKLDKQESTEDVVFAMDIIQKRGIQCILEIPE